MTTLNIVLVLSLSTGLAATVWLNLSRTRCSRCRKRAPWRFEWRGGVCPKCTRSTMAHRVNEAAVRATDQIHQSAHLSEYEYDEAVGIIAAEMRSVFVPEDS